MVDLAPGTELAQYRLNTVLGYGGMGAVFAATDLRLHRPVAIKIIRPDRLFDEELRQRFIREARVAAAVEHPNVVPIYEVDAVDDLLFIAMRYVSGHTLADAIAADGPLTPTRSVSILTQVAHGLHAAHEIDLVHRDVKPSNVLLADHGAGEHAYLADFGLARFIAATGLTASGKTMGTLPYMSPEQVEGLKVDRRTDVYALGCVLHEMLTGSVPFPRDDSGAILFAHLHAVPPQPSSTDPGLVSFDEVIGRSLAKDPDDRYPTTLDVSRAAAEALASAERPSLGSSADTSAAPYGGRDWPSRITQAFLESSVPTMSSAELEALVSELRRRSWSDEALSTRVLPLSAAPSEHAAIVVVYRNLSDGSRTRELLEVLPAGKEAGLMPQQLGELLTPDEHGLALGKASVRAVIRNLQRVEKRLLLEESISRRILCVDWDRYDADGAGRYYVEAVDREALDAHVAGSGAGRALPSAPSAARSSPVLVWQKNPRPAIYHLDGECSTLRSSAIPDRSVRFAGRGSAGWLPLSEAEAIPGARPCGHCM